MQHNGKIRRALYPTALVILSLSVGAAGVQGADDKMVDVGGHRLHISEAGPAMPVVVFESGLGEDVATWSDVQPQVALFAHTVVYDRAGLGKSETAPGARTIPAMAAELHTLLHAAKINSPYILVGHSLGGTMVQVFAHSYPAEVAGLVLVDPESGKLIDLLHSRMNANDWDARQKALDEAMPKMPPAVRAEFDANLKTGNRVDEIFPLPHVPVLLLTGTRKNPEFPGNPLEQDLKLELHRQLLAKIPNSRHVLVPNSRHYIQNDAPGVVVDAIREVISKVSGAKSH